MATTPVVFSLVPEIENKTSNSSAINPASSSNEKTRRSLRNSGWSLFDRIFRSGTPLITSQRVYVPMGGQGSLIPDSSGAHGALSPRTILHHFRSLLGSNISSNYPPPPRPPNTSAPVALANNFTSGTNLPLAAYTYDMFGQLLDPSVANLKQVREVTGVGEWQYIYPRL